MQNFKHILRRSSLVLQDKCTRIAAVRSTTVTNLLWTTTRSSEVPVYPLAKSVNDVLPVSVRYLATAAEGAKVVDIPEPKPVKKTEVTYDEVVTLIEMGSSHLYDVREPNEIEQTGVIQSAVNIPLTKLKASLMLDPDDFRRNFFTAKPAMDDPNIIFYGLGPVKSMAAVEIAHKLGFKKARHYPGGFEEWSRNVKMT